MSAGQHIHVIDGKQLSYPNDRCPICRPEIAQPSAEQKIPNVHRTGNTIVYQATKLQMATTNYYAEGKCLLHSVRKAQRDANNKLVIGADGKPLWNQITIRYSMSLMKDYVNEVLKLIHDVESGKLQPEPQVPKTETSQTPLTAQPTFKEAVIQSFPSELASMLYFEETTEYVMIHPRQYLGSDNFAKIAQIVRDRLNGEYISAGTESHFSVRKVPQSQVPQRV